MLDAALIDELKSHYGLTENPFSARVSVFYDGAQRKHNLEILRHMAIFGDMVLLLTGDSGTGKSTLIEKFAREFSDEINITVLAAGKGVERVNSIERLATLSGLELPGKHPPRDLLEHLVDKFSEQYQRSGKRSLVIVDDAQALPDEELAIYLTVMSSLEPESGSALLLVGLPSLTSALAHFNHPDRDEWFHQVQLKPLTEADTLDYLRCRLKAVGYAGEELLSASQLAQLSEAANGVPGVINRLFPMVALDRGALELGSKDGSNKSAQNALYVIAFTLALAFVFLSYQHDVFTFDTDASAPKIDLATSESDGAALSESKEDRLARIEQALQDSGNELGSPPGSIVSEPAVVLVPIAVQDGDQSGLSGGNSKDLPGELVEVIDEEGGSRMVSEDAVSAAVDVMGMSVPAPDLKDPQLPQTLESGVAGVSDGVSTQVLPAEVTSKSDIGSEKQAVKRAAGDSFAKGAFRAASWVMAQPDGHYAAQVLGSYSEGTAKRFAQKLSGSGEQVVYIRSLYKGKAWFVVLYGQFQNKAVAQQKMALAPVEVKKQKPWLRSFAGIKSSL